MFTLTSVSGQRLVAKEQHFEVKESAAQLSHEFGVHRAREVNAINFTTDGGTKWRNGETVIGTLGKTSSFSSEVRYRSDLGRIRRNIDSTRRDE